MFAGVVAAVVAVLGTLAGLNRDRIKRNEQAWLGDRLTMVLPHGTFDNDPLVDRIFVTAPDRLGTSQPVPVYRARLQGRPTAAVILSVAPDGYRGPLQLLVSISYAGTVLGVQVIAHSETHGLGDQYTATDSTWLSAFTGRSLPAGESFAPWSVRKDGGDFDQYTGATVTPRAIVKAVQRTLEYYDANRNALYAPASQ